jgi:hypothetical protein
MALIAVGIVLWKWAGAGVVPLAIAGIGRLLLVFWLWLGRTD